MFSSLNLWCGKIAPLLKLTFLGGKMYCCLVIIIDFSMRSFFVYYQFANIWIFYSYFLIEIFQKIIIKYVRMTEDVVQFLLKRFLLESVLFSAIAHSFKNWNINHLLYNKRYQITGFYDYAHFVMTSFCYVQKYSRIFVSDDSNALFIE